MTNREQVLKHEKIVPSSLFFLSLLHLIFLFFFQKSRGSAEQFFKYTQQINLIISVRYTLGHVTVEY